MRAVLAGVTLLFSAAWFSACTCPKKQGAVKTIELTPPSAAIQVGETQTFTAVAKDEGGKVLEDVGFTWTSSNPAVATIADGTATGQTPGETGITASAKRVTSNGVTLSVAPAEQANSLQRIDAARARGELNDETALIYKVFAIFGDERLPRQYLGDDRALDGTALMDELVESVGTLSSEAQATLQPFLLTPPEAGSWFALREAAGEERATARQVSWGTVVTANNKVKLWYHKRFAGDAVRAQRIADEIDGVIWPKLTGLLREPLPDCGAACPRGGGDERIDIYLVDTRVSLARRFSCCQGSSALVLLSRQASFSVVAHELMHVIASAYPRDSSQEYHWLSEASAKWAENYVYPKSNMDPDYPSTDDEHFSAQRFLLLPDFPLEYRNNAHEYGAYLLPFYLAGPGQAGSAVVKTIWENATNPSSLGAVNAAIAGGFEKVWPEFVLHNWNQDPVTDYRAWDGLQAHAQATGTFHVDAPGEESLTTNVKHLAANYYAFTFTSDDVHKVIVENPLAASADPAARVQALVKIGGQWRAPEDWTKLQKKKFCRDKPEEHVEELVIIISNSEWQDRSHVLADDLVTVKSLKEGCTCPDLSEIKKWTGHIAFSYSASGANSHYTIQTEVSADVTATLETSRFGGPGSPTGTATIHQTVRDATDGHLVSSTEGSGNPTPIVPPNEKGSVLLLSLDQDHCRYNLGGRVFINATVNGTSQVGTHVGGIGTAWRPLPDDLVLEGGGSYPAHSSNYLENLPDLTDSFGGTFIDSWLLQILGEQGLGSASVTWRFAPVVPHPPEASRGAGPSGLPQN
ncbi:Ig-like domain-containing protein [Corallococcus sp. CA054B]|uniref:Ig-like domain-containing protein n=1 Tax=Corallococcus sp. CA054B TaxID=2316734 RepID=UPI000EA1B4C1|nr:Ig-like domain-containing protein [Corallococcus sp. CA054B]RKG69120.1 Ig-like domain-containing protein [Corallococcus sp. CA054B]